MYLCFSSHTNIEEVRYLLRKSIKIEIHATHTRSMEPQREPRAARDVPLLGLRGFRDGPRGRRRPLGAPDEWIGESTARRRRLRRGRARLDHG